MYILDLLLFFAILLMRMYGFPFVGMGLDVVFHEHTRHVYLPEAGMHCCRVIKDQL